MNMPILGATDLEILVRAGEPVSAKHIDNPLVSARIPARPDTYPARMTLSDNDVEWLVIAIDGKLYGWPRVVFEQLVDDDKVRIFRNGKEVDLDDL